MMMKMTNETNALAVQGKRERKKINAYIHKLQLELRTLNMEQLPSISEVTLQAACVLVLEIKGEKRESARARARVYAVCMLCVRINTGGAENASLCFRVFPF
jgi:hypothetical protein